MSQRRLYSADSEIDAFRAERVAGDETLSPSLATPVSGAPDSPRGPKS